LALGACAPRQEPFFTSRPGAANTNPAVNAACRDQSQRIIARQDRSQLMREDERDSRLGAEATPFSQRSLTDRLGREFQYERMVNECVRQNTQASLPPAAAPAPEPAVAPAPLAEPIRSRRGR
jgi:hypothetical protein